MHLVLTPRFAGQGESGNVIAEVPGSDAKAGTVLIGGHLDSWDLGTGAIDDGAGVAITTAAAKRLLDGPRPKRTIRVVWFGAEEPGGYGGKDYARVHGRERHATAGESDFGADRVWRFETNLPDSAKPVGDRGLAMALAGDPVGAVNLMLPIARQPGATPKLRQNLALALALSGRWQDARMVANMDLSPTDTDKRLEQWASFARPSARYDQVASLLGVRPAADPGQPVALALNASTSPVVATATPVDAFMPKAPAAVAVTSAAADAGAPIPAAAAPVAVQTSSVSAVVFGPRAEIVQPLPAKPVMGAKVAALIKAPAGAVKTAFVKPMAALSTPGASKVSVGANVGRGNFFVQLGAYDNAGVARDGWARASRVYSGFAGKAPQGMPVKVGGKDYYRLSVGGFDEAGARRMCAGYRAKGGVCFVRASLGDQAASFPKR